MKRFTQIQVDELNGKITTVGCIKMGIARGCKSDEFFLQNRY